MKAKRKDSCKTISQVVKRNIAEYGYSEAAFFNTDLFPYIKRFPLLGITILMELMRLQYSIMDLSISVRK